MKHFGDYGFMDLFICWFTDITFPSPGFLNQSEPSGQKSAYEEGLDGEGEVCHSLLTRLFCT